MDGSAIDGFISNLAPQEKLKLGLPLQFDNLKNMLTCFFRFGKNFISSKTESWFFFSLRSLLRLQLFTSHLITANIPMKAIFIKWLRFPNSSNYSNGKFLLPPGMPGIDIRL